MSDAATQGGESQTLHPSKVHSVTLALGCVVCSAFLFRLWLGGIEYAWVAGGFLAASAIYYASHLLPGNFMMTLDRDGLTIVEFFSSKRYRWANMSDIALRRGMFGPVVEFFDLTDGAMTRVRMTQTYGYRPRKLAELMMEWRQKMPPPAAAPRKNVWRA